MIFFQCGGMFEPNLSLYSPSNNVQYCMDTYSTMVLQNGWHIVVRLGEELGAGLCHLETEVYQLFLDG